MRRPSLLVCVFLCGLQPAVAQQPASVLKATPWPLGAAAISLELEFAPSSAVTGAEILRRDPQGVTVMVSVSDVGGDSDQSGLHVYRHDTSGRILWQRRLSRRVDVLPAPSRRVVPGWSNERLAVRIPPGPPAGSPKELGRVMEIDERDGFLATWESLLPPHPWESVDAIRVMRLPGGDMLIGGSVSDAPEGLRWWMWRRTHIGIDVWTAFGRSGFRLVDFRPTTNGVELIVATFPNDLAPERGLFLVKLDAAGRLVSDTRLGDEKDRLLFMPDGGQVLVTLEAQQTVLTATGPSAEPRYVARLPQRLEGQRCLLDGSCVVGRPPVGSVVSPDGRSAVDAYVPGALDAAVLDDGWLSIARCTGADARCNRVTISLYPPPR